jgi:hypothetical protein
MFSYYKMLLLTDKHSMKVSRKKLYGSYHQHDMEGDGIFEFIGDKVKKFKTALYGRPKVLNDVMESTKGVPVVGISVCRKEIPSTISKLLNILSFGMLKKKMQALGYDKLFHLYSVFHLSDGRIILIEKNERVVVSQNPKEREGAECTAIKKMSDGKDIKSYIEILEAADVKDIYKYASFSTNCQHFQRNLLNTNGIFDFDEFVSQNVSELVPNVIKKIANFTTGLAAGVDVIKRGGGYMKGNGFFDAFVQGFTAVFKDPVGRILLNVFIPGSGEIANVVATAVSNNTKGKKYASLSEIAEDAQRVFGSGAETKIDIKDLRPVDVKKIKTEIKQVVDLPEGISMKDLVSIKPL